VFQLPGFPLTKEQKNYFLKKARRSFVKLFLKYLKQGGNGKKAIKAIRVSGIGIKGLLKGVFQ
jgi:hypothetical protein